MAAAFPTDFPALEGSAEFEHVTRTLGRQVGAGVQLTHLPHATAGRVLNALREAEQHATPYDIFHIICHGLVDPSSGVNAIVLEDEEANPAPVTPPILAALLGGHGLQAVFLNACASAGLSAGHLAPGFAQALLGSNIPALIGMQAPVRARDAVQFAEEFYAALADGRAVEQALLDVRRVTQARGGGSAASAIPVCYTRTMPLQLRRAPAAQPPWWQRAWRWLAAVAVLFVSIIGGYLSLREFFCEQPVRAGLPAALLGACAVLAPEPAPLPVAPTVVMVVPTSTPQSQLSGDVKIAVADFGAVDASGAVRIDAKGAEIAQHLYDTLKTDLDRLAPAPLLVGANLAPGAVGMIAGANLAEQVDNAARRAGEINADMLIFGNLQQAAGKTLLTTYFYLAPGQLVSAEELGDGYPLLEVESPGLIQSNAVTSGEMREKLLAAAGGVADLVLGMGYYNRQQYGEASLRLAAADAALVAATGDKRAVVQLFLGTTAAQLGDLPLAHQYYDSAYNLDPRFARALIGRGQTTFLQARDGCIEGRTDVAGIQDALADYQQALNIASSPLAAISTKANLSMGSAYLCLAMAGAGDEYWEKAQQHLSNVIGDYTPGSLPQLQYLAAQAYERRGALALAQAGRVGGDGEYDPALLERAGTDFEQAVSLSLEPGVTARSHLWLAWAAARQDRCAAAREHLQAAAAAIAARRALDSTSPGYQDFAADIRNLNELVQPMMAEKCPTAASSPSAGAWHTWQKRL